MAQPPMSAPAWNTIPPISVFRGESVDVDLTRYATGYPVPFISFDSTSAHPSWLTVQNSTRLVGDAPTTETEGTTYNLVFRARNTSGTATSQMVVLTIAVSVAPVLNSSIPVQSHIIGTPLDLDMTQFLTTVGMPSAVFSFTPPYQPPSWLSFNGSSLVGTPPLTGDGRGQDLQLPVSATNVAGTSSVTFALGLAYPTNPAWLSVPAQYAIQNVPYSVDVSSYFTGSPTPTITATGLPGWLRLSGTTLAGTPTGYTSDSTIEFTLHATNVRGTFDYTMRIRVRVTGDLFAELPTGSPISVSHNKLTALTVTATRIYYAVSDTHGTVYAVNHSGQAQSSETLTLNAANGATGHPVQGLANDGDYLYVLCGTNSQYVHKYQISNSFYEGSQDIGDTARGITIGEDFNGDMLLMVLLVNGQVSGWSILFPGVNAGSRSVANFGFSVEGLQSSAFQAITYDSVEQRYFIAAETGQRSVLYAFSTSGNRDHDSTLLLDASNWDPRGVGYYDDKLYVAQFGKYTTPPRGGTLATDRKSVV